MSETVTNTLTSRLHYEPESPPLGIGPKEVEIYGCRCSFQHDDGSDKPEMIRVAQQRLLGNSEADAEEKED